MAEENKVEEVKLAQIAGGQTEEEYYAEYDGVVLMVVSTLAIKEGDPIIAYGR